MVATDAHMLRLEKLTVSCKDVNCILPKFKIDKLEAILKYFNITNFNIDISKKTIKFYNENFEYYLRLVDGVYPNYLCIIPKDVAISKHITFTDSTLLQMKSDFADVKKLNKNQFFKIDVYQDRAEFVNIDLNIKKTYPVTVEDVEYNFNFDTNKNFGLLMPMKNETTDAIVSLDYVIMSKAGSVTWKFFDPKRSLIYQDKENVKAVAPQKAVTSTKNATPKVDKVKLVKSDKVKPCIKVIDYSDKAIALIGDTKAIKDELLQIGGKYNKFLKCGAGWIFSKARHGEAVNELLERV